MTSFSLRQVKLRPGEEHRDELEIELPAFEFGGQRYMPVPEKVPAAFVIKRATTGTVFASRSTCALHGPATAASTTPCWTCRSTPASTRRTARRRRGAVDARTSTTTARRLRLGARRGRSRAPGQDPLPARLPGLCPACGKNLNDEPHDAREEAADPRWAALRAPLRDERPAEGAGLGTVWPPMAVPKRKTSKSRRDKRRARTRSSAAGQHLPAVQLAEAARIASARPAARTRAARSSGSASPAQ